MLFDPEEYTSRVENLTKYCKRVEVYDSGKRQMTKSDVLKNQYKVDIITSYNSLLSYICEFYSNVTPECKAKFDTRIKDSSDRVKRNLCILNLKYNWSNDQFAQIVLSEVIDEQESNSDTVVQPSSSSSSERRGSVGNLVCSRENTEVSASNSSLSNTLKSINDDNFLDLPNSKVAVEQENELEIPDCSEDSFIGDIFTEESTMKVEIFEYLGKVSRVIKDTFNGDPLALPAFLAAIDLADTASKAEEKPHLLAFIKTRLEGRALECVPTTAQTVKEITDSLKRVIKPETSTVVTGRLLALRSDKLGLQKFQEQANELAEALRRSYISDGIPSELANTMTIEKTKEMCRQSTSSLTVKTIIASSQFAEPKEVLAKYITETATDNREHKVLAFRPGNNNFSGNYRRGRYNNRNFHGNNYNNNRNNYNNNRNNNNNNRNHYNNYNNRGYFNNNRGNGNRYYNNNNGQPIRMIQENDHGPTPERAENRNGGTRSYQMPPMQPMISKFYN